MGKTAGKLSDFLQTDKALFELDISADQTSAWFPMALFRQAIARLQGSVMADGEVITVAFLQATDGAGAGSKALGATTTATSTGAQLLVAEAEIDVTDMDTDGGFTHVAVFVTSDGAGAIIGSATLIRDRGRN